MQPISINLLLLIGIVIVFMFFGYAFGLYEGRGQGYKKRKTEEFEEKKDNPTPVSVIKDDPGLLRLKNENNQLRLDMDGQRVDTSAPLAPAQRKRLIDLLTLIRPILEGGQSTQAAPQPAPVSPAVFTSMPTPVSPPAISSAPIRPAEKALVTNSAQPKVEPVPARISLIPKKKTETPAAALSMVQQIDEILQLKLADTPLARQGIKIQDAPGGGVMVMVGLNKYEGVGDVPDPAIKAVLQAAVAEWEKKYTPGL